MANMMVYDVFSSKVRALGGTWNVDQSRTEATQKFREIVQFLCNYHAVSAPSALKSYGARILPVKTLRRNVAVTERSPCRFLSIRIQKLYIFIFVLVLWVVQYVTESKPKNGKGLLLFQDRQGCNDLLLPSSDLSKLQLRCIIQSLSDSISGGLDENVSNI